MKPISRFSLESHDGPYESWPLRSRLLADGAPTPVTLPGYVLVHQYETEDGYLLVTDYDCLFEEATCFTLVSRDLRVLASREIGAPYRSFLLTGLEWIDARRLVASFSQVRMRITLRPSGIPLLRPRLQVRRLPDAAPADAAGRDGDPA